MALNWTYLGVSFLLVLSMGVSCYVWYEKQKPVRQATAMVKARLFAETPTFVVDRWMCKTEPDSIYFEIEGCSLSPRDDSVMLRHIKARVRDISLVEWTSSEPQLVDTYKALHKTR